MTPAYIQSYRGLAFKGIGYVMISDTNVFVKCFCKLKIKKKQTDLLLASSGASPKSCIVLSGPWVTGTPGELSSQHLNLEAGDTSPISYVQEQSIAPHL